MQHVTSAASATPLTGPAGRRSRLFRRRGAATVPWHVPYVLLAPAALALGAVVVLPFVYLVVISFQQFRARELIQDLPTVWVGLANYQYIVAKPEFWAVLGRTLIFAGVNVALTVAIGMGIALLLQRLGTRMRLLLSISMVLAWATPTVTATQVWQWLFDRDFGVVNWVLTSLRLGAFTQHSWLSDPTSLLGLATLIVVWGALPFVALVLYAGLSQVPEDLYEAARVDGANAWATFRQVSLPLLAPILLVLTLLSTIWDFRVFTQIFVLQKSGGISEDTNLIGIWAYHQSFGGTPNYGRGAATAFIGVVILLMITAVLVRRMVRIGDES
ncbi:MAG TPA: sugar ABC transporter permease [Candidatus Dormibacteraeota bacterium]|nr:sugar ABC transporter permease [Candidatus Dormibacteraeota bacterium]